MKKITIHFPDLSISKFCAEGKEDETFHSILATANKVYPGGLPYHTVETNDGADYPANPYPTTFGGKVVDGRGNEPRYTVKN